MSGVGWTLGAVGALAVGAAVAHRKGRGSRAASPQAVRDLLDHHCDEGLYHVTRTRLLPAIRARGLVPSPTQIKPTFDYFSESGHLTGKVFLAAGVPAAAEWWMSIRAQRQDAGRSAPLSLLRVRPDRIAAYAAQLQHDQEGASDVHVCSFSLRGQISPEDLEVARPSASFGRTMSTVIQQIWDAQGGIRSWARPFVWVPLVGEGSAARTPSYLEISSDLFRESGVNATDFDQVERYAASMRRAGGWGRFPPISGQIGTVDAADLQNYRDAEEGGFEHELAWSRPLTDADLGRDYVAIEDGHHRAHAARMNRIPIRVRPFTWGKGRWTTAQIRRWREENP